jgi:hypothetical protein
MTQKGFKVNASVILDSLFYTYNSNSNQLQKVQDTSNNFKSLIGDFKYDPDYKNSTDYYYDGNGNLTKDKNKFIDTIQYNFLNLPEYVSYLPPSALYGGVSGDITYTYDASGNKLKKTVTENCCHGTIRTTTTTYIDGFVYESYEEVIGGSTQDGSYTIACFLLDMRKAELEKRESTSFFRINSDFRREFASFLNWILLDCNGFGVIIIDRGSG